MMHDRDERTLYARQQDRIAALEAELAAERERWEAAERELHNIAHAMPSEWDENVRDQFQQWAQNRARAYLDAARKD